jgi:hypothetical protein
MKNCISDNTPALETVQQQFKDWRSGRGKQRGSIPQHLWDSAVGLCQRFSIARVSRSLCLSYSDLKKRALKVKEPAPRFMEIDLSSFSSGWQVECERPDGARLRMTGSGQAPAVEQVLARFLS